MKEISVIGATSPLGINLISHLVENGYRIFASYRSESRIPEKLQNHSAINWIKTDLSEEPDFTDFCRKNVIWLAHLEQGRFNNYEIDTNLKPFKIFLERLKNYQTEKFVFISSGGAVYGEPEILPISEDHPRNPLSSYGKTKKNLEETLIEFGQSSNFKTAILRPGNIYGFENPQKEAKGIVAAFLKSIRHKTPFTLIHKGQTTRDFIHVNDVSRTILSAIESDRSQIIWNVGTGKGHKIAEVLEMIINHSDFERPEIIHHENYTSDVSSNILSINRIISESAWLPLISIEDGIKQSINNWLNDEHN